MGAHSPQTIAEQAEGPNADSLSRVVLGALPRGHKVRPLVAEFGHYITVYADPQVCGQLVDSSLFPVLVRACSRAACCSSFLLMPSSVAEGSLEVNRFSTNNSLENNNLFQ